MAINNERKEISKKYILIYTLGYLNALKSGCIDIKYNYFDDKSKLKFHTHQPYFKIAITSWLEENNFEQNFIDLIYLVIELEDVYSVVLNSFNESLDKCINLTIKELKKTPQYFDKMDNKIFDFLP